MAVIPGTNVAAMIVPFDDQDIFATHNDKYGRGGFRVVSDIAERDGISELRRKEGMWVRVLSTGKLYELLGGIANTNWVEVVCGGTGSTSPLTQINTIVAKGSIVPLDVVSLLLVRSLKWLVTAEIADGRIYQCEVAAHVKGATPVFVKYGIVGDRLDVLLDVSIETSSIVLSVFSNEPLDVTFSVLRIPTLR